jgi:hypothetical protein
MRETGITCEKFSDVPFEDGDQGNLVGNLLLQEAGANVGACIREGTYPAVS